MKKNHVNMDSHVSHYVKKTISPYDIAIIGMACRFPQAEDYNSFWKNLINGIDAITEIPQTRWDIGKYYSPDIRLRNKTISKWGGLLHDPRLFDNRFFRISPREAKNMDPQQRILLEETWHCIEDAGIPVKDLQKKTTSCFVGATSSDYSLETWSRNSAIESYTSLGNLNCICANRLSYFFGFTGISIAIDAADASSLVAIHEARKSLINRESDFAFAAGVNINTNPWKYISYSQAGFLSPDGKCKAFDNGANGYVPGDGVGIILMQRLEDAVQAKNHIHGLITGTAVNHTGTGKWMTAPNAKAWQEVITGAYKDAGISPFTVSYIETHGTGRFTDDIVEIQALTRAFRDYLPHEIRQNVYENEVLAKCPADKKDFISGLYYNDNRKKTVCLKNTLPAEKLSQLRMVLQKTGFIGGRKNQFCEIGSVKTNIGHLEAAAGIAGIIKVILMLRYRGIPPSLNITLLNPLINFPQTPFKVTLKNTRWLPAGKKLPLRAGINAFGFGGVNSHVILEEYTVIGKTPNHYNNPVTGNNETAIHLNKLTAGNSDAMKKQSGETQKEYFLLSARSVYSMEVLISQWKKYVKTKEFSYNSLSDICKTLIFCRENMPYRCGTFVSNKEDICSFLGHEKMKVYYNTTGTLFLRIGNIMWDGADNCKFLFKPGSPFLETLKKIIGQCFEEDEKDIIRSEIYSPQWSKSKEMRDLFSFLTGYVLITVLKEYGLNYDIISGEGNGFLLALVLSKMVPLMDIIQVLRQRKKLSTISLSRPVIPFYDHVNNKTIMPFDFDDSYIALMVLEMGRKNKLIGQVLVDGILYTQQIKSGVDEKKLFQDTCLGKILASMGTITQNQLASALKMQSISQGDLLGNILIMNKFCKPTDVNEALQQQDILRYFVFDVLNHYVNIARLLINPLQNNGPEEFTDCIGEWNNVLKKYGRDINTLLYDKYLFTPSAAGRGKREKLLLLIILVSSFRRMNRKWDLTEEKIITDQRFNEILDMVDDGVIPKKAIIDLMLNDNPDYKEIARIINSRQHLINKNKDYSFIKKQNLYIQEIRDPGRWIDDSLIARNTVPENHVAFHPVNHYTVIRFGTFITSMEVQNLINIDINANQEDLFLAVLQELWLNGFSLNWEKLPDGKDFNKIVLPSYPFDRKPFWIEKPME